MTLKEFTEWVQGIALVKALLEPTPAKTPRKPRKPKPTTEDK
jgi:hypothetical protein